jgi:Ankyrin repeat
MNTKLQVTIVTLLAGLFVVAQAEDLGPLGLSIAFGDAKRLESSLPNASQEQKDQAVIAAIRNYVDPMYSTGGTKSGYVDVVRLLLEDGADPNAWRLQGYEPPKRSSVDGAPGISIVSSSSRAALPEIVKAEAGGTTALRMALKYANDNKDHPLVKVLLEHGATDEP